MSADKELADRRAQEAAAALAAAQQLWSVQEQLHVREQELAAVVQERAALAAQVGGGRAWLVLSCQVAVAWREASAALLTPRSALPPCLQVSHLTQQLASRDQQLDEASALLKRVAEAKELQRATNEAQKQLHAEQLRVVNRLLEQVGPRGGVAA